MASTSVAQSQADLQNLRVSRSEQFGICRLLRFWDSKNDKKQGEFMGITLLLLDAKDCVIHGFINASRAVSFRPYLKAGTVVKVSRFEVARCATTYKITENPFLIRFIAQTSIEEVTHPVPAIKPQKFMLRSFEPLQALATSNLELPDVVGQIQSVQGSDLTQSEVTTRIFIRFLIEPQVVVYLTLWDDVAAIFRGLLRSGDRTQSILVVTTVNPKLFGGNLYLNSTPGTKFLFDPKLDAIARFTSSLGGPLDGVFTCTDTKEGLRKKEIVSIGELNKFISNTNEHAQEADFLCKARIVEVLYQNGWSFVSCTRCGKKLEQAGASLRCPRCVNPNITGVIKYRVEICVDDGADGATFVVFDREMVKLTSLGAAELAPPEVGEGEELPPSLANLAGKEFVFQIRVTPFNFTPNHRTFTVSTIHDSFAPETFNTNNSDNTGENATTAAAAASVKEIPANQFPGKGMSSNPSRKRPHD